MRLDFLPSIASIDCAVRVARLDIEYDCDCGVHVHINTADLNEGELFAVYAAFVASEDWFGGKVEATRLNMSYSRKMPANTLQDILLASRSGDDFTMLYEDSDRYKWINASAMAKHKTFENRLHEASWDYEKLSDWIITNLRFVRAARLLTIDPNETPESFKEKVVAVQVYADQRSQEAPTLEPATALQCA